MECNDCSELKELKKRFENLENKYHEQTAHIKRLMEVNEDLNRRLAIYENAHTPPSKQITKRPPSGGEKGTPGQKEGHAGTTRPTPEPTEHKEATMENCPHCSASLGESKGVIHKIITDIPDPQPVKVTDYVLHVYDCPKCHEEIVAGHPDLPAEGDFGKNILAQTTLMKYEDRLPHRKIQEALNRQFGLMISPGAIFDFTRRTSDSLIGVYNMILDRIRDADVVHIDETSLKVDGKNYWIWVFTTDNETFYAVRKSRGTKVLEEILTRRFRGIVVCDGWKAYPSFIKELQRCWAHLLRESSYLADRVKEAVPLNESLLALFHRLKTFMEEDHTFTERKRAWYQARYALRMILGRRYWYNTTKKFVAKIRNGLDYWFTFLLHPGVEPTNNRAERAIREPVVQRKIFGTLRNEKGTRIFEVLSSVLATWKQEGKPLHQTLVSSI
jgi:transposase